METLSQLVACLNYLKQLMTHSSNGDLFMTDDSIVGDNLLLQVEMINVDCFYGRCLGFQVVYCPVTYLNYQKLKTFL